MRLRWDLFKSKLFIRYLLSYLSISLIPLIVLTSVIYNNSVTALREEIELANINQLKQSRNIMDTRMSELYDIASRITYDEQLTPYMVHDPYYAMEATNALRKYKASNSIISELFLYYHGDNGVYSSRGVTDVQTLLGQVYRFSNWSLEQFKQDINEIKQPIIRPVDQVVINGFDTSSMLVYLVPIPPNDSAQGTVMFFMEEKVFSSLMDPILKQFQGKVYIFDNEEMLIASRSHGNSDEKMDLHELAKLSEGTHNIKIGHESHSVVVVKSETNGWTYVASMPSDQFFDRVQHIKMYIWVAATLIILGGALLAVYVAKRQYHPIHDLFQFVKKKNDLLDAEQMKGKTEFDWIKNTLSVYSDRVDIQEPYVRNQYLMTLLRRGAPNDEEADQLFEMLGLHIDGTHVFVAMIAWEEAPDQPYSVQDREYMIQMLTEVEMPERRIHIYGVELAKRDQMALIINMERDEALTLQGQMEQVIHDVHNMIRENSSLVLSIGVGSSYTTLERINQSYIEAATALEYRMIHGKGSVTFFDSISVRPEHNFWIPKDTLLKLTQSLKQGNAKVAIDTLRTMFEELKVQQVSIALLRSMSFDMINTVMRTASDLGIQDAAQYLPEISQYESLEELELKLGELSVFICNQMEKIEETEQRTLLDEVILYIDKHYAEYSLSLEQLAEEFRVSVSYLSRSIKEKTGETFSQYVWHLRMNEVIRLITTTDQPLKDIITQVGYHDAPNFIRKFKKEMGVTPGQYRKNVGMNVEDGEDSDNED
ncbi:helix-turn-helix domain-containing protein [Paenibacillus aquistagni]|uniref:helix-turn-helix domain-containing protein n=1 Tax=Paenibacillus aquistagni TaxID=1852522 RepID=UPI001F0ED070|nr:helix-turn-helix domain-containing protein [Paenibacillus aquistagni]